LGARIDVDPPLIASPVGLAEIDYLITKYTGMVPVASQIVDSG
jgi:hypothetical protein